MLLIRFLFVCIIFANTFHVLQYLSECLAFLFLASCITTYFLLCTNAKSVKGISWWVSVSFVCSKPLLICRNQTVSYVVSVRWWGPVKARRLMLKERYLKFNTIITCESEYGKSYSYSDIFFWFHHRFEYLSYTNEKLR